MMNAVIGMTTEAHSRATNVSHLLAKPADALNFSKLIPCHSDILKHFNNYIKNTLINEMGS